MHGFHNVSSTDLTKSEFRRALGRLKTLERASVAKDIDTAACIVNWKRLNPDKTLPLIGPKALMLAAYLRAAEQVALPDTAEARAAVREACNAMGVAVPARYRKK